MERDTARRIAEEVAAATAEIFARHGLEKPKVSTRYGDGIKITLDADRLVIGASGINEASEEALAYKRYPSSVPGMQPGLLGKVITLRGESYRFIGYNVRSHKYPLAFIRLADGRQYKWSAGPDVIARLNAATTDAPAPVVPVTPPSRPLTRLQLLAELAAAGYDGPTSYTASRLAEILDEQNRANA